MAQRKILRSSHLNAPFLHFCHLSNSNRIHTKESQEEKHTHNGREKTKTDAGNYNVMIIMILEASYSSNEQCGGVSVDLLHETIFII